MNNIMLDTTLKIEKKEATAYPPLPEDIYQVQLVDITSKEEETFDSKKDPSTPPVYENTLSFQFSLLDGTDGEESLRCRNVWHNFVSAFLYIGKNGKNNLYRIIEALLGRDLTLEEEANGIDGAFLNNLVGKQCRIGTKHKKSKDGTKVFDNIETYYPARQQLAPLTPEELDKVKVKPKDASTGQNEPSTAPTDEVVDGPDFNNF